MRLKKLVKIEVPTPHKSFSYYRQWKQTERNIKEGRKKARTVRIQLFVHFRFYDKEISANVSTNIYNDTNGRRILDGLLAQTMSSAVMKITVPSMQSNRGLIAFSTTMSIISEIVYACANLGTPETRIETIATFFIEGINKSLLNCTTLLRYYFYVEILSFSRENVSF